MSDPDSAPASAPAADAKPPRPTRLRRLCQALAVVALLWAIVTAVRALTPPAPLDLARQAVEIGHFDTAVSQYLQHLARKPEDWGARLELARVLREIDQPRSLIELRKIPPGVDGRLEALKEIATICLESHRYQEAQEALLELEQKTPDDGDVQLMLAECYFRQGQARAALLHAQKAAKLNPQRPRAHSLAAEALDELNRPAEMVEPLRQVLTLEPDNYAAHLNLSYAFAEAGLPAPSKEHAEWCLVRNPADAHARRFLALALRDQGKPDEALVEIERALQIAPGDVECRVIEAELLLFQRKPEEALKRLKPFYESHPGDRGVAALLARAAAAAGREDEAEQYRARVQKLSE